MNKENPTTAETDEKFTTDNQPQGGDNVPTNTKGDDTTPEETPAQKKAREKQEKKDLKAKKKAEKDSKKPKIPKESKPDEIKPTPPTPTKPAAVGKKPANVSNLENVKLLVRPVMKKGDATQTIVGYACRPLSWGDWRLGEGEVQEIGTVMVVNKNTGKRAAMSFEKFEKEFDWQADVHINCRGGQCPK